MKKSFLFGVVVRIVKTLHVLSAGTDVICKSMYPFRKIVAVTTLSVVLVSICSASYGAEKVKLQLKWFHQFQFAGYYAAKEKGYYSEAGFDVEILQRNPKISQVDAVINGDADFGVSDASLILHRLQGRPVVVLGVIFQHSPLVLLTRTADKLLGPYELKGKRVMYQRNLDDATLTAMFHQLGIRDAEITHVPHTFNDNALVNKSVDAMSAYVTNQPYYFAKQGLDVHVINPINYGIDFYGDMLFATEAAIKRDPERAQRFLNASVKGWQYALTHKEEIVDLIKNKYGSSKTLDHLRFEADETEKMILPNLVDIGHTNIKRFNRIADIYRDEGMVTNSGTIDGIYLQEYMNRNLVTPVWFKIISFGGFVLIVGLFILLLANRKLNSLVERRTKELGQYVADLEWSRATLESQSSELVALAEEQSHLRDLAQSSELAKASFLASMSHEIRTPMTGVLGMADILLKSKLNDDQRETALSIKSAGETLLEIINDILDQSKLDAGKIVIQNRDFYLPLILSDVIKLSEPRVVNKEIVLLTQIEQNVVTAVHGDSTRLKQILTNLIGNAVKFTTHGSIVINVTNVFDSGQQMHRFEVIDTGIGISEEGQSRLFQRFEQADRETTHIYGGSGLGLSICKQLVELMGGSIGVTSRLGVGSNFWFQIPLEHAHGEVPTEKSSRVQNAISVKRSLQILVAEDNDLNQMVIRKIVGEYGHHMTFAHNGREAIDALGDGRFDLILMDIRMPVLDGLEATKIIRGLETSNTRIPIIALTADVMKEHIEKYASIGIDAVAGKPIVVSELLNLINGVMGEEIHFYSDGEEVVSIQDAADEMMPASDDPKTTQAVTNFLNSLSV